MRDEDRDLLGPLPEFPLARHSVPLSQSASRLDLTSDNATASASRGAAGAPSSARETETKADRRTICMDYDDQFSGEVVLQDGTAIPHGCGTLLSRSGRHCYVGGFSHRYRDGYGKLMTEHYVLWCRWRMNRPDFSFSCRADYPNGDKYCGFLTLQASRNTHSDSGKGEQRMSRFSQWVQSTTLVRRRWGELVTAAGSRYFGEWEANQPHGFGCYAAANGDRYIGRFRNGKFHDTGVLFSRTCARDGATRLPEGANLTSDGGGEATAALPAGSQPLCIFDGVWEDGKLLGEGHVTLPGGTRVTADWRGASQPSHGEVIFKAAVGYHRDVRSGGYGGAKSDHGGGAALWHECFHWEPLLCGAFAEQHKREFEASAPFRERLAQQLAAVHTSDNSGGPNGALRGTILEFLNGSNQICTALRIFRRSFFFFYGTCGQRGEIADGPGNSELGWCYQRHPFGGCVHLGRGQTITKTDLRSALVDIFSFSRSVLRWTAEMLGDDNLQRLEMLEVPVNLSVGRWVVDAVLAETHNVLLNLYVHAYAAEEVEVGKAQARLRGRATLDDMGVGFARRHSEERLFDPYADATHCIEQLGAPEHCTLSSKLAVLLQWSRDIDLSTRLAQTSSGTVDHNTSTGSRSAAAAAGRAPCGSADDLLPIHQYVLSQARLRHLHAHTRMLADFAEEPAFVDATSQDSFCVTNLVVCALTLPQLHQGVRDTDGVLVPVSFFVDRLRDALQRIPQAAVAAGDATHAGVTAEDLASVALGYLASWLPEALALLAAAPRPLPAVVRLSDGSTLLPSCVCRAATLEELTDAGNADADAEAMRSFCWRAAGSVLAAVGITFGLHDLSDGASGEENEKISPLSLDTTNDEAAERSACVRLGCHVPADVLPSFLLRIRDDLHSCL